MLELSAAPLALITLIQVCLARILPERQPSHLTMPRHITSVVSFTAKMGIRTGQSQLLAKR